MKKVLGMALLAGLMVVGTAAKSEAAFIAYICDTANCTGTQGTNWFALADGAAVGAISGDANANGHVLLPVSIGGLTVLINSSQSKPLIGSASNPQMDLLFSATGSGTVWFYASDTGFTSSLPVNATLSANWSGNGSITACVYGFSDNSQLSLSSPSCANSGNPLTSSPVTALWSHAGASVNPFAITLGLKMSREGQGTITGDFLLETVPEPGSMVLLGTGLLGLAGLARRRFAKK